MADNQDPIQPAKIDMRSNNGASQSTKSTSSKTATTGGSGKSDDSLFAKFEIPDTVRSKYPDIIPLILETESMNDDERQYWFQILPIMSEEQVNKLRAILLNEKQQLSALDKEYEQEIKRINSKHVAEWKEYEIKEKRKQRQSAESSHESAEQKSEEELLKKLHGL